MATETGRLFGRAGELRLLEESLGRAATGALQVVFLEGESGIGKSSLLAHLAARARSERFEVFSGRCDLLERHRALGPLLDALGNASDLRRSEVMKLAEEPAAPDEGEAAFRLIESIGDLVESIATDRPVALAVDDLHWADSVTVSAIRSLAKRLMFQPALLAVAFRPLPRSAEIDQLIEAGRAEGAAMLSLSPLSPEAMGSLVEREMGAPPSDDLLALASRAGGNPLFAIELLASLRRGGAVDGGQIPLKERTMPPDLRAALLRHLAVLSDEAFRLLRIAAILGTQFLATELAAIAGAPVAQLLGPLEESMRAGFVVPEGPRLRFRHDLIREALYEDLPEGVRRALHLDAARALADAGAPLLIQAQHYALGADHGDEGAFQTLVEAARTAARSPASRVELFERAISLLSDDDPRRTQVRADLVEALISAGKPAEANELAVEIMAGDPNGDITQAMRFAVVRALSIESKWTELLDRTSPWLSEPSLQERDRGLLLGYQAHAGIMSGGDKQTATSQATTALSIGERLGDDLVVAMALIALMWVCDVTGQYEDQVIYAQRAVEVAARSARPEVRQLDAHVHLGIALHVVGRLDEADAAFSEGLRLRERLGSIWDLPFYLGSMAHVHERTGRWDDAISEAEACITTADEVNNRIGVVVAHIAIGKIMLCRGDIQSAEKSAVAAQALVDELGPQWGDPAGLWAHLFAARSDLERAVEAAHAARAGARPRLLPDVVPLLLAAGRRDEAERLVARAEEYLVVERHPWLVGLCLVGRGLLNDDPDVLRHAVEEHRRARFWDVAIAAEYAAAACARQGQVADAEELFREALQWYERLDARLLLARAHATMRALGVRGWKRSSRGRARVGWEALTTPERRIAEFVAQGLTNPQIGERLFISRRTVQSHLRHAFVKLGIASRSELAAEVARRSSVHTDERAR